MNGQQVEALKNKTTLYASVKDHYVNGVPFVKNEIVTLITMILNTECESYIVFKSRNNHKLQLELEDFMKRFKLDSIV